MLDENKRVVEINGVRLEVAYQNAKIVEHYKVGDAIKVLVKKYSDTWESFPGMIIGFDAFENRPSLIIAYLVETYSSAEIKTLCFNKESKDIEISHVNKLELILDKNKYVDKMYDKIRKLKQDIEEVENQITIFLETFGEKFKLKSND